ncbi:type II toxin-antitoxin system VapC family toxin [Phenylobacterium sp.]|uniref:type II toxin-antitoxin system VapC family toxin n=1 Tax=Phenylobacterium sp. TaxID=1871053 RepID=UPI002F3F47E7
MLLDTHVLLWSFAEPERLGTEAAEAFRSLVTATVVSAASLWEIAIKRAAGRLAAPDDFPDIVRTIGHEILPIRAEHAWRAGALPPHHRDPFDRLLVAQAEVENLTLMTHDRALAPYGIKVIWA